MNRDNLVECGRCGSDASYLTKITEEITLELCYGCGFQTHTILSDKKNSFLEEQMEILPDLYKSLIVEDEEGKIWIPTFINVEDKGMVFAEGTSKDDWRWSAVKAIPIEEGDREKFKGKFFKPDMDSKKYYLENDFMDALSYVGLLPE